MCFFFFVLQFKRFLIFLIKSEFTNSLVQFECLPHPNPNAKHSHHLTCPHPHPPPLCVTPPSSSTIAAWPILVHCARSTNVNAHIEIRTPLAPIFCCKFCDWICCSCWIYVVVNEFGWWLRWSGILGQQRKFVGIQVYSEILFQLYT